MFMASPVKDSDQKRNVLSPKKDSGHQNDLMPEDIDDGSTALTSAGPDNVDSDKLITPIGIDENVEGQPGNVDLKHGSATSSSKSGRKGKKAYPKLSGRRYPLRSSVGGVRVLRSMSKGKCMTPTESVSTPVNPVTERRRNRIKVKKPSNDEFSRIRKRMRYLLTRMNYEQNLIDAYSGEGWKGQSLEKIKPEKELQRAKSEILRCKLKIRDLFRQLDSLLSEGRLQESLFDTDGQISSEDISCAKCGSKDLSADNDIILCDGTCSRGFHQKCLNPPLLSEDVPPGDEGWLCPACDCKVDCIYFLNEFQGSDLSIEDMWEKVFPEAAAILNGDNQYDHLGLPSDDSEDDDFNPDALQVDVEDQEEGSSSGESDFTSSSEDSDSRGSNHDRNHESLGLPSDDSEDDDYDPNGPDPIENVDKDGSSSDGSDFTSDSDVFMDEITKTSDANEASASLLLNSKPLDHPGEGNCAGDGNKSSINSELVSILEPGMSEENALPVSGKRQRERLDYKMLYDETYGKTSSDSSDDDDWCGMSTPKKGKKDDKAKKHGIGEESVLLSTRTNEINRSSRSPMGKLPEVDIPTEAGLVQQVSQVVNENTPERPHQKFDPTVANHSAVEQQSDSQEPDSNGNKATSVRRSFGRGVSQKLLEYFKENQYATRERKERLAAELGITTSQVSKWFENARRSARAAAKEGIQTKLSSTPQKGTNPAKTGGNHINSDKGAGGSSARHQSRVKESGQAGKSKFRAELDGGSSSINGNKSRAIDDSRQKAIARELRKMRKSR